MYKKITFTVVFAYFLFNSTVRATDWYVSQNGSGSVAGTSATNAQTIAWLDTAGTWNSVSGVISSGDTIHLCGTLNTMVYVLANNMLIHFEPGARISVPAGMCISLQGHSGITIDGGGSGIIENTANGTGLANQIPVDGIAASGSANVTVENLIIQNLYIHTNIADAVMDGAAGGGIYANGMGGTLIVSGCTFSNVPWCLNLQGQESTVIIVSNAFVNYDHGVGFGASGTVTADINSNSFGSTANWDTGAADAYHHDGIHFFGTATMTQFLIRNNTFSGDWGSNNTAHVYLETGPNNVLIYNNTFIEYPGDYLANGFLQAYGPSNQILNNTFLGSAYRNSTALTTGGQNTIVQNNIFSGVTTFITARSPNMTYGNNFYANPTPGGNSPWASMGTSFNTVGAWQAATAEPNAFFISGAPPLDNDGSPATNNSSVSLLTMGLNLSNLFNSDIRGLWRSSNWEAGAFALHPITPPVTLAAPSNLRLLTPQAPAVTNYMIASVSLGSLRNNATLSVGRAFTARVGMTVIQLGRWVVTGNNQSHVVGIYDHAGNLLGSATVNTTGAAPGAFVYGALTPPVSLNAGSVYSILSSEVAGGDSWYDNNTSFSLVNTETLAGCAEYSSGGACSSSSSGPQTFGPVDAQYTVP